MASWHAQVSHTRPERTHQRRSLRPPELTPWPLRELKARPRLVFWVTSSGFEFGSLTTSQWWVCRDSQSYRWGYIAGIIFYERPAHPTHKFVYLESGFSNRIFDWSVSQSPPIEISPYKGFVFVYFLSHHHTNKQSPPKVLGLSAEGNNSLDIFIDFEWQWLG